MNIPLSQEESQLLKLSVDKMIEAKRQELRDKSDIGSWESDRDNRGAFLPRKFEQRFDEWRKELDDIRGEIERLLVVQQDLAKNKFVRVA